MKPCISKDGRHNFPIPGASCANGCGITQDELSGIVRKPAGNTMADLLKAGIPKPQKRKGIHSELHETVSKLRFEFKETATKGKGSFGFYLKLLKPVPIHTINIWLANINDSPKLNTPIAKCKVFWWNYSQWKKNQKEKKVDLST